MKVLIVAKTRMRNQMCVGGIVIESNRSVRLLTKTGDNQPVDTPFDIGELWEIDFHFGTGLVSPHVEDVLVQTASFLGTQPNLTNYLLPKISPWRGYPDQLFDGSLGATSTGRGFVSRNRTIPRRSTGFWIPDQSLRLQLEDGRGNTREIYRYPTNDGVRVLPYVGCAPTISVIPPGTLVRISLARWWSPDGIFEERCYLQLSGWFL